MTKEQYFEMCEQLGTEPVESEIPVEYSDFPAIVQTAFTIYYMLRDIWDPMGGNYMGKDTSVLFEFFNLYEIEHAERLLIVGLIQQMDNVRSKIISEKQKQLKEASSNKKA